MTVIDGIRHHDLYMKIIIIRKSYYLIRIFGTYTIRSDQTSPQAFEKLTSKRRFNQGYSVHTIVLKYFKVLIEIVKQIIIIKII